MPSAIDERVSGRNLGNRTGLPIVSLVNPSDDLPRLPDDLSTSYA